ncbi:hypothetical protein IV203_023980 [Nitzschia inconspicua]|uniref:Uncharacterized protein n=1 Tax=Nitzschia inconspicua TaxID=303405 RepID=A0A9K3PAL2_9STRA|nr:hypothetical protein IV203_024495 [Nitzschia inconspicua]KAG7340437.1 hypothetical protein IV203_023980 [Nitzschia inconspicua]
MFAFGGHGLLIGGGSSLRRDDVGVVSIRQEVFPIDNVQLGIETIPPSPGEQFDRSLRDALIDKNKVELVLRMSTNADQPNMTTARAFARTVFSPLRLSEWKRLVEERHWKSISFCHRRIHADMRLINFHDDMLYGEPAENRRAREDDAEFIQETQLSDQLLLIPEEDEEAMWRGLVEPCRNHTQRLELMGELRAPLARVITSVLSPTMTKSASAAAASSSLNVRSPCRLRILCCSHLEMTAEIANILGAVVRGPSTPSCLKEISFSNCTVERRAWSLLLGIPSSDDLDRSEGEVPECHAMNTSQSDIRESCVSDTSMRIVDDHTCDSKPRSIASSNTPPSSLSRPPAPPSLHALYLSDCNLTQGDVREILSALRGHPMLRILYLNGQQDFVPSQVDTHLIDHLKKNPGIEQVQLPSQNQHSSQIQSYAELNRCGRRLLRFRNDKDQQEECPVPLGLWPHVLERIRRLHGLSSARRANAVYYFVKELHGVSTNDCSGGTRSFTHSQPSFSVVHFGERKDPKLSRKSTLTASTSVMSDCASSTSSHNCADSTDQSVRLTIQSLP